MTKFADQLFDDLMRDHGSLLADTRVPAAPKRRVAHPVRLGAIAGGAAAAAAAAGLVLAGGASPAYAVTTHADTVSVAVYNQSGIAGANAALRKRGERIVLVPVKAGCESVTALPLVSRDDGYQLGGLSVRQSDGSVVELGFFEEGPVTLSVKGIPKGDVDLVLVQETSKGMQVWSHVLQWLPVQVKGRPGIMSAASTVTLTKAPAPSCVSVPVFKR